MKRRELIGALGMALAAAYSPQRLAAVPGKLHIITLSFDDGFKKSFLRTAEIYEKFGLSACFNIVAAAHLPGTVVIDDYMPREQFGDFGVWNELQDRGHEVMIHGYQHAHLARLPLEKAKELVLKSLDLFAKELRGFQRVTLQPGEKRTLTFTLPAEKLAYWDETTHAFVVNPGAFDILVGASSEDIRETARIKVTRP